MLFTIYNDSIYVMLLSLHASVEVCLTPFDRVADWMNTDADGMNQDKELLVC